MQNNKILKLLVLSFFIFSFSSISLIIIYNEEFLSFENVFENYHFFKDKIIANYFIYYVIFFLIYFFISVFALPLAGILCLLIGALFGFMPGVLLASFASSLGALVCFLMARYLFKNYIEKNFNKTLEKINKGIEKDGIYYLFFVRMTPVFPFFLINLLFSVTKIRARSFYFTSQIGMLFGTALFINAGTQLSKINSVEDIFNIYVIISIILIATFPIVIKKIVELLRKKNK